MSSDDTSLAAPVAAIAVALGVCCGLPLLASAGVTGAIAGVVFGSWSLLFVGVGATVFGIVRWRRSMTTKPGSGLTVDPSPSRRDSVGSSPGRWQIDEPSS